jgi:formate-dependent nitrite reductase membrane component NrfD
MSYKKEQVTEVVGIVSAAIGLVKLIVSLFKPKKECKCDKHQSQKDD